MLSRIPGIALANILLYLYISFAAQFADDVFPAKVLYSWEEDSKCMANVIIEGDSHDIGTGFTECNSMDDKTTLNVVRGFNMFMGSENWNLPAFASQEVREHYSPVAQLVRDYRHFIWSLLSTFWICSIIWPVPIGWLVKKKRCSDD